MSDEERYPEYEENGSGTFTNPIKEAEWWHLSEVFSGGFLLVEEVVGIHYRVVPFSSVIDFTWTYESSEAWIQLKNGDTIYIKPSEMEEDSFGVDVRHALSVALLGEQGRSYQELLYGKEGK